MLHPSRARLSLTLGIAFVCQTLLICTLLLRHGYLSRELANPDVKSVDRIVKQDAPGFSWERVPSLDTLFWQPCYERRECARLAVPLDYQELSGRKASIALVRKKAEVPTNSPFYRGPVLINPGGPGASGVDLIGGGAGDLISTILGPQFDIVGFDPRGIARSTPRASFFNNDVERALWIPADLRYTHNHSYEGVGQSWSRAQVVGKFAAETDDGYLRHIHTDHTARDMLAIVEAHGRSKLQYWGFSYGSILGATFASMFPDRIERLIIDGVADAENYYAALWSNNLRDADKVMNSFFTGCAEAGPDVCAFWAPKPEDIRRNLTSLYTSLTTNPIPVYSDGLSGILDNSTLRTAIFLSLYSPYARFPILSKALADPVKHAATLLNLIPKPRVDCSCGSRERMFDSVADASIAVVCNDGEEVSSDLAAAQKHYDMMSKLSEWGPIFANIRITCSGWPKLPKNHFRGPFEGNTSHPILLIGTTGDPVTPLWAAHKMSRGFTDSVVLTQDSLGHCSVSGPSLCTQQYIRNYFLDGTLPKAGTICPVFKGPFGDLVQGSEPGVSGSSKHGEGGKQSPFDMKKLAPQDRKLYDAIDELSRHNVVRVSLL